MDTAPCNKPAWTKRAEPLPELKVPTVRAALANHVATQKQYWGLADSHDALADCVEKNAVRQ